ncbi:hypothetical protein [Rhodococcus sp. NPDC004095]
MSRRRRRRNYKRDRLGRFASMFGRAGVGAGYIADSPEGVLIGGTVGLFVGGVIDQSPAKPRIPAGTRVRGFRR